MLTIDFFITSPRRTSRTVEGAERFCMYRYKCSEIDPFAAFWSHYIMYTGCLLQTENSTRWQSLVLMKWRSVTLAKLLHRHVVIRETRLASRIRLDVQSIHTNMASRASAMWQQQSEIVYWMMSMKK